MHCYDSYILREIYKHYFNCSDSKALLSIHDCVIYRIEDLFILDTALNDIFRTDETLKHI